MRFFIIFLGISVSSFSKNKAKEYLQLFQKSNGESICSYVVKKGDYLEKIFRDNIAPNPYSLNLFAYMDQINKPRKSWDLIFPKEKIKIPFVEELNLHPKRSACPIRTSTRIEKHKIKEVEKKKTLAKKAVFTFLAGLSYDSLHDKRSVVKMVSMEQPQVALLFDYHINQSWVFTSGLNLHQRNYYQSEDGSKKISDRNFLNLGFFFGGGFKWSDRWRTDGSINVTPVIHYDDRAFEVKAMKSNAGLLKFNQAYKLYRKGFTSIDLGASLKLLAWSNDIESSLVYGLNSQMNYKDFLISLSYELGNIESSTTHFDLRELTFFWGYKWGY